MHSIIGIDPGPQTSGFVGVTFHDWHKIHVWTGSAELPTLELIDLLSQRPDEEISYGIEWLSHMGMPAGAELFDTARLIGRMEQEIRKRATCDLVPRNKLKMHHCHSMRAKDAHIRQAMIDRFGGPGKKASPGQTYGISSHAWQALAVAAYVYDTRFHVE